MRNLSRFVTFALALFLTPGIGLPQAPVCGDQNGNGAVEGADVFYLIHHLFSGGPASASCPRPAPVARTGQTISYGAGTDGERRKGVAWPNPRFTDNGDGTVADNLTTLIWLKDPGCFATQTWANALTSANTLASGACGLTDGSVAGDWRLPNLVEQESLLDLEYAYSEGFGGAGALSNTAGTGQWSYGDPFTGSAGSRAFWSSTTETSQGNYAWIVDAQFGNVFPTQKTTTQSVWPLRGGTPSPSPTAGCGDEDGDGTLGSIDVFYLINYLFAGGPAPAGCPPAPTVASVAKTGQTMCYDTAGAVIACAGTGQDGEKQMGASWPDPRFADNGDGTVSDNLTGLVWLKNANCFGPQPWSAAVTSANTLASGTCGLTDGSAAGDWRLPNRFEQESLRALAYPGSGSDGGSRALSNAAGTGPWTEGDPFSGVQLSYWSSTTYAWTVDGAWSVSMQSGATGVRQKSTTSSGWPSVWPVRGGQ